ncbi:MAG: hypothetical protein U0667_01280 [Chloroflexota bacterium]
MQSIHRIRILAAFAVPLLGLAVLLGASHGSTLTIEPLPDDLSDALADHGMPNSALSDAAVTDVLSKGVGPEQALKAANEAFPPQDGEQSAVYLARVTKSGQHVDDEKSPLMYEDRAMYVVQRTGTEVFLHGGVSVDGKAHEADVLHERDIFIDARSGEFLWASSFR